MVRFSSAFPLFLVTYYTSSVAAEMVGSWSYADAAKWARNADLHANFVSNIKNHEIDGKTLLVLEDNDIKNEMEVASGIARKKILNAIAELKAVAIDPADNEMPPLESEGERAGEPKFYPDFTAYRAIKENRRRADFSIGILLNAPYFGLLKVKSMGLGPSDECGWLEYFFCPGLFVARNSDRFLYGLPWLARASAWLKVLEVPVALLTAMKNCDAAPAFLPAAVFGIMLIQLLGYIFAVVGWYLYPIVPWFICDALFYLTLFGPFCNYLSKMLN